MPILIMLGALIVGSLFVHGSSSRPTKAIFQPHYSKSKDKAPAWESEPVQTFNDKGRVIDPTAK